jgi:hypothetical protein
VKPPSRGNPNDPIWQWNLPATLNSSVGGSFKPLGESLSFIREYPKQDSTLPRVYKDVIMNKNLFKHFIAARFFWEGDR